MKYWRLAELATRLDEIRQDIAATNDLVKKISKYHLVIFDDFFTTEISTHATRVLFEIMEARTGQATAIVSQTGASDWGKFIPNQVTAEVPRVLFLGLCLDFHYFSTGVVFPKFGFYFSRRAVAQALVEP